MYVELHSCSAFSFLEGASLPEDLIAEAARLDLSAIALLDRDGVYGSPRFHMAATKAGIRAHVGAEISVEGLGTQAALPKSLIRLHRSDLLLQAETILPANQPPEEDPVAGRQAAIGGQTGPGRPVP